MKKILMGLVAACLTSFAVPAFADDAKPAAEPAAGEKPAKAKKAKKAKKADKAAEGAAEKPADAPAK